jgi:hypothetical protein
METSIQEQAEGGIEVVNAQLNYLAEATPKPVNYAYDPPAGVLRSSGKHVAQNVAIRNGREVLDELSLDTNGFVLTPHETAVRDFYDSEDGTAERKAGLVAGVPFQRMGKPDEIAQMILFLASDKASFSTGATFAADGGKTAR